MEYLDYDMWFEKFQELAMKKFSLPQAEVDNLDFVTLREYFYLGYNPVEVLDEVFDD